MSKFSVDKKGYNQVEVDEYINNLFLKYEEKLSEQKDRVLALKTQLQKNEDILKTYVEKDKQISQALVFAVEKAEQIETSAKKIYDLEIKRIRLLYNRWEELLLEVEGKYPQIGNNRAIGAMLETFKDSISDVLNQNFNLASKLNVDSVKQDLKKTNDTYVKNIINKMEYAFDSDKESAIKRQAKQQVVREVELQNVVNLHDKESSRINNIASRLNSITKSLDKHEKVSPVEKFIESDIDEDFAMSAYAKNITRKNKSLNNNENSPFNFGFPEPNETGFDLKEALNPKEDLDEIMKAFDFFEDVNN